jgi:hypothetical protein
MSAPWRRRSSEVLTAIGAIFFCMGLVLMPALGALDLAVGLACRDLGRAACAALFQPPLE